MTSVEPRSRNTGRAPGARPFVPVAGALKGCFGGGRGAGAGGPRGNAAVGHPPGGGSLDESARRLSHEELLAARAFAAEGHSVRAVPERRGRARTADLDVCGTPVEVKSWLPLADRDGVAPNHRSVVNKLISAEGQGRFVVIVAGGSGLSASDAAAGVARYAVTRPSSSVRTVRVIGDGFDLSWRRSPTLMLGRSRQQRPGQGIGM
jgi:hypothetical protein